MGNQIETPLMEIWETEEEKGLSAGDLKNKYYNLARERISQNPLIVVINKEKKWQIELSRRVIAEWRVKSRTRERILSIQLLEAMITEAKYIKTVDDLKNTSGIESVSYFENQCKINGKIFKINITIKTQTLNKRRFAYYYSAIEI